MSAAINTKVNHIILMGIAGIFVTSSTCLGFGGISVGGIGVGVGVGGRGVGVSVGAGSGGGGVGGGGPTAGVATAAGSGGVSVGGGGVSVGRVGATVSVGGAVSDGAGGATADVSTTAGTGGVSEGSSGVSVGSSGVSVGSAAAAAEGGLGAGGSATVDVGGSGSVGARTGAVVTGSASSAQAFASERAALQMGMGPDRPDRGMAQALGDYYGRAPVAAVPSVADQALQSAVSAVPELPSAATAPVESATQPAETATDPAQSATDPVQAATDPAQSATDPAQSGADAVTTSGAPRRQASSDKARAIAPRTTPPGRRTVGNTGASQVARYNDPRRNNRANDSGHGLKVGKFAGDPPSLGAHVVNDAGSMSVVIDPPGPSLTTSVIANWAASQTDPSGQSRQGWTIAGIFSDLQTSSFPTAVPILIVMLLSAASAYGFVRLMSEKCPRCAALLERHSAGCRNCGAQLRPTVRVST